MPTHMQKNSIIAQFSITNYRFNIDNYFLHAQVCLTTPISMNWIIQMYLYWIIQINLLLLWMSNYTQKFNFIPQIVCDILYFKESCTLIGLEVLGPYSKTFGFCKKLLDHLYFYIQAKKIWTVSILVKIKKISFMGHFWRIFGPSGHVRRFCKNRASSLFLLHDYLTSPKNQKKSVLKSWAANGRTDSRTELNS